MTGTPDHASVAHAAVAGAHGAARPLQAMGPGAEFDLIRHLMSRWQDCMADIGDDAALLPPSMEPRVVSTDATVEGVHFRHGWLSPRDIGARAVAAAFSDLAAMGASAESILLALVVPPAWEPVLAEVADGIGDLVRSTGARITGGNLSRGDQFSITSTVIGRAPRPVPRSGARVGDRLVVTGTLGGPGQALAHFLEGGTPSAWARARFVSPRPRLEQGQRLAAAGATAMIDLSDGLAADARHVAAASGCHLAIDPARVPGGPGVSATEALASGEEYELLAAVPADRLDALLAAWDAQRLGPLTVIGEVVPLPVGAADRAAAGAAGHDHFAR
jgi:thiamine-monophosphate kinase